MSPRTGGPCNGRIWEINSCGQFSEQLNSVTGTQTRWRPRPRMFTWPTSASATNGRRSARSCARPAALPTKVRPSLLTELFL